MPPAHNLQEYLHALNEFAASLRSAEPARRPQNLRFGRLYVTIGCHTFEAIWNGRDLVKGTLPYHDSLNQDLVPDRAAYACDMVAWALHRIDLGKI